MSVLFGTVEYFESEILTSMSTIQSKYLSREENLNNVFLNIKKELLHDFVCDEALRKECLDNCIRAYEKCSKEMAVCG